VSRRGLGLAAIGVVPGSGFGWQPARAEAAEAAAAAADVDKAWKAAAPRVAYSDFMQLVLSDRVAEVRVPPIARMRQTRRRAPAHVGASSTPRT
jgi:hypothetical protein